MGISLFGLFGVVLFIILVGGVLYHIYYLDGVKDWKKLTISFFLIFGVASVYISGLGMKMQTELVCLMLVIIFIMRWGNLGKKVEYRPYLDEDGVSELVAAVAQLSRKKCGATIVIERDYDLEEVIETGKNLDSIHVDKDVVEMIWKNDETNLGAMVIRNSRIISVNGRLPLVTSSQLSRAGAGIREYACLGAVETFEAAAICVNGSTGKISLMGHIDKDVNIDLGFELKDMNIESGVSEEAIRERLTMFLIGKKDARTLDELNNPKPKESKKKKLTKEERLELREQKKRERLEKKEKGKKKAEPEQVKEPEPKGFFG
ncbi:hypothetical protein FT641_17885 [Bacillus paranthracis]|uniref:DNA integrity scanning protein DisA nucleotide-binding domain protein n=1 Tax=Bacillus paranthracis TaxID=2026186 RepID=UPI001879183C|nr:DNA integrity scanning protein DisA nucleotide-binding domain protein [Bacillus paranthracis]MBE7114568.1 hypothetical protein [Bacillus paranthracis]MBE7154558.1 hypothetical protein [Bacillus paranthracis]